VYDGLTSKKARTPQAAAEEIRMTADHRAWAKTEHGGRIAWRFEAFAQGVAEGLGGTEAAKQAGYSPKSAHV
jgi:hypothetical protein